MPRLSVILPTNSEWADLTHATLDSYNHQTSKDFEVILVDDNGPSPEILNLSNFSWNFPVRYYVSTRPVEKDLAHKNHARNVGWKNAQAEICFVCDCDFVVEAHFVQSVLQLWDEAALQAVPFVLYPPCAMIIRGANSPTWPQKGDYTFDPFLKDWQSSHETTPALKPIKTHPEGMHIISKRLLQVLGGYDEAFLGWGANKMEFQQRINETALKQYFLDGVLIYHQQHEHRGDNSKKVEIKSANVALMGQKRQARKTCEDWKARATLAVNPTMRKPEPWLMEWIEQEIPASYFSDNPADFQIKRTILREKNPEADIMFVGPWVGEFGWEVCRWQGGVRLIAERAEAIDHGHIIVCGDEGHHQFYPYAHEYWTLPKFFYKETLTRESQRVLPEEEAARVMAALKGLLGRELIKQGCAVNLLPPSFEFTRRFIGEEHQSIEPLQPSDAAIEECQYILRSSGVKEYVVLFPRKRNLNKAKNWPDENWLKLIKHLRDQGLGVVAMGREEDTAQWNIIEPWFISTVGIQADRRLDLNIAFLKHAKAAISCESGGPYLSMLCCCPTLIMGAEEHQERYEKTENFLDTRCRYIVQPNYEHAYEDIRDEVGIFLATDEQPTFEEFSNQVIGELTDKIFPKPDEEEKRVLVNVPLSEPRDWEAYAKELELENEQLKGERSVPVVAHASGEFTWPNLKILFVGDFSPNSTNHSQVIALGRLGHAVTLYDYREKARVISGEKRDIEIVEKSIDFDLVVFSKCNNMDVEVVQRCSAHAKIVLWYMDPVHNIDDELMDKVEYSDYVFCNIRESYDYLKPHHVNVHFLQEGFDLDVDRPHHIPFQIDVAFIGKLYGDRMRFKEAEGFKVISNAYGEDHAKSVSSTKINLNFTTGGASDRVYKILAAGGFLLTQVWPGMNEDFTVGRDLVTFHSIDDLRDKIEFYLIKEDLRERIAANGLETVQKFSRDNWAKRLISISMKGGE